MPTRQDGIENHDKAYFTLKLQKLKMSYNKKPWYIGTFNLVVPADHFVDVNLALFKFIWGNKKDKIKHKVMVLDNDQPSTQHKCFGVVEVSRDF